MATEENDFTEQEQFEIDASLCLLYTRFKGQLKNIVIQNKLGIINYGQQRDKITVSLIESSDTTIINKDLLL